MEELLMARSMNVVCLSGYLAADPKAHVFDNGDKVATLRLAVNTSKKVDGEFVDEALFLDCQVNGARVDSVVEYLAKGSFVLVDGSLGSPRSWQGDDGQTRFTMVIKRANVTFGPKGGEGGGSSSQSRSAAAPAPASTGGNMFEDSDIPFAHPEWRSRRGDRCPQI
jgi:single-strand DNA-binding protein